MPEQVKRVEYSECDLRGIAFKWWLTSHYLGKSPITETSIKMIFQKYWPWSSLRKRFREEFLDTSTKFLYSIEYYDDGRNYQIELIDRRGYIHFPVETDMLRYVESLNYPPRSLNGSLLDKNVIRRSENGSSYFDIDELKRLRLICFLNH